MTGHVIYDQPDEDYRAVPAAHYSALKVLLDTPARYAWQRDHPATSDEFDLGHIVHGRILGVGEDVAVLDFPDRRTKAYKDAERAARDAGRIPILTAAHDEAVACATAILEHPLAGPILTAPGRSEVAVYWTDERTGVPCKAKIDRVVTTPDPLGGLTHWLIDLKTVGQSAAPSAFGRHAAKYDYHLQAAFYRDGYSAATGARFEDVRWLNVVAEKKPPHLVSVVELDAEALNVGQARYGDALEIYRDCVAADAWPGYTPTQPATVALPRYATYTQENDE